MPRTSLSISDTIVIRSPILLRSRCLIPTISTSRILRELYSPAWLRKSGRESCIALATKLGIDDQTVRSAIARMQKSVFLKTWSISLNPYLFGMDCQTVILKTAGVASKEKIIYQLELVEGVVAIFSFLDEPGFRVVLFYEDDEVLERRVRRFIDSRSGRALCVLEDTVSALQHWNEEN